MLEELLTKDTVLCQAKAANWEEVIRLGGQMMVKAGYVEPGFVDAMVSTVKEMGPYIVLAPHVAMPHARPEDGALQVGSALVTLQQPVNFGNPDHDPVSVAVFLCAPNKEGHMTLLSELAEVLDDDDFVEAAKAFTSVDDVHQYLANRE